MHVFSSNFPPIVPLCVPLLFKLGHACIYVLFG